MNVRSLMRGSAVMGGIFLLAFAAAGLAARTLDPAPARTAGGVAVKPPTQAQYDSATVEIRGTLAEPLREQVAAAAGGRKAALLVVSGRDSQKCEDLGRQLRELQRSAPDLALVIATDSASVSQLALFARRERLRVAAVLAVEPSAVIDDQPHLSTPAMLVVPAVGAAVAGVGHSLRFSNARVRSFAAELQPLLQASDR